jgi:spore coat polysaccharide biosynthesis protein SpsF
METRQPKFACLITVRTGSGRLPCKAILDIRGKKAIEHVIERAKNVKNADMVVVCTSTESEDDILESIAEHHKVKCFRGSAKDRLGRMVNAIKKFEIDYIVTCDGDDLFCDPELIDIAIKQMLKNPCDIIKAPNNLICGAFTFCINKDALKRAYKMRTSDDTEMYDYLFLKSGVFSIKELEINDPVFLCGDHIRATLDYQEDLDFFRKIFDEFKIDINTVPLRKIIDLIQKKPEIARINFFRQNDYLQNREIKNKLV